MRNRVICMILLLCLFLLLGCGRSPKESLYDTGLFGEHSLLRLENFGAVQGTVSGNFFLGIGSVNGSLGSEFKLQFYWSPKPDEIIITALSYSKFRFIIDETKNMPTIEFVFNNEWLNWKPIFLDNNFQEYDKILNLNEVLFSKNMELARVRISSATMEKEIYLPKAK